MDHVHQDLNLIRNDIAAALLDDAAADEDNGLLMVPQQCLGAVVVNKEIIALDDDDDDDNSNGDENDDTSTTTIFQDEQEHELSVRGLEKEDINVFSSLQQKSWRFKQRRFWRRPHAHNTAAKSERQSRRSVTAYDSSWLPSLGSFC